MIIQIFLAVFSIYILFYFLVNRRTVHVQAYKKLAFVGFTILMFVFILFPNALTEVANKIGIGRGADLLLYGVTLLFILFAINMYIKFKEQQETIHKLAR